MTEAALPLPSPSRGDAALPLHLVTFVAVDVETTGLDCTKDDIVAIGGVKVRDGRLAEEFETLVYVDRTIPWDARRVHGISNEMLVGKPRIKEALHSFLDFAGDGTLVEHSGGAFDVGFLERAHGGRLEMAYINTCSLSRKLFPHIPKHSLDACCARFGIVNEMRADSSLHGALSDARATAQLLVRLLELAGPRYPTLAQLVAVCEVERDAPVRPLRSARRGRRSPWKR